MIPTSLTSQSLILVHTPHTLFVVYKMLECKLNCLVIYKRHNMESKQPAEELQSKPDIPNTDITLQQSKNFESAGLNSYLIKCYHQLKYHKPTPIQYYSISTYLQKRCRSIVAQSKSGTGKTLSYLSVLLSNAIQSTTITRRCSYLIILPTRQLSIQVYQTFKQILNIIPQVKASNQAENKCRNKLKEIKLMMCIGGIPFEDDRRNYNTNGGTVLVGTVGRIIQFFEKKLILVNQLEMLILDQGDKLFENKDKRFKEILDNVMKIKDNSQQKVQILIYSATFNSKLIKELHQNRVYTFIQTLSNQENGLTMKITDSLQQVSDLDRIVDKNAVTSQSIIDLQNIKKYKIAVNLQNQSIFNAKCKVLITLLQQLKYQRCLVFVQKKMLLEQINQRMIQSQLKPLLIHGSLSQSSRIKIMNQINQSKIIVASDLLARGIDLQLDLVILFDAKKNDTFWHRIGRTGRFGSMGVVVSLDDIPDWKQYDKEEAQTYLDEINCSFDKNKGWYGTYLTEVGQWNVTSKEKELKLEEEFKYFDEQKFSQGRKVVKRDEIIQQNIVVKEKRQSCSFTMPNLLAINSETELNQIISQFLNCSQCQKFMTSIQNLTGYKFKIKETATINS